MKLASKLDKRYLKVWTKYFEYFYSYKSLSYLNTYLRNTNHELLHKKLEIKVIKKLIKDINNARKKKRGGRGVKSNYHRSNL